MSGLFGTWFQRVDKNVLQFNQMMDPLQQTKWTHFNFSGILLNLTDSLPERDCMAAEKVANILRFNNLNNLISQILSVVFVSCERCKESISTKPQLSTLNGIIIIKRFLEVNEFIKDIKGFEKFNRFELDYFTSKEMIRLLLLVGDEKIFRPNVLFMGNKLFSFLLESPFYSSKFMEFMLYRSKNFENEAADSKNQPKVEKQFSKKKSQLVFISTFPRIQNYEAEEELHNSLEYAYHILVALCSFQDFQNPIMTKIASKQSDLELMIELLMTHIMKDYSLSLNSNMTSSSALNSNALKMLLLFITSNASFRATFIHSNLVHVFLHCLFTKCSQNLRQFFDFDVLTQSHAFQFANSSDLNVISPFSWRSCENCLMTTEKLEALRAVEEEKRTKLSIKRKDQEINFLKTKLELKRKWRDSLCVLQIIFLLYQNCNFRSLVLNDKKSQVFLPFSFPNTTNTSFFSETSQNLNSLKKMYFAIEKEGKSSIDIGFSAKVLALNVNNFLQTNLIPKIKSNLPTIPPIGAAKMTPEEEDKMKIQEIEEKKQKGEFVFVADSNNDLVLTAVEKSPLKNDPKSAPLFSDTNSAPKDSNETLNDDQNDQNPGSTNNNIKRSEFMETFGNFKKFRETPEIVDLSIRNDQMFSFFSWCIEMLENSIFAKDMLPKAENNKKIPKNSTRYYFINEDLTESLLGIIVSATKSKPSKHGDNFEKDCFLEAVFKYMSTENKLESLKEFLHLLILIFRTSLDLINSIPEKICEGIDVIEHFRVIFNHLIEILSFFMRNGLDYDISHENLQKDAGILETNDEKLMIHRFLLAYHKIFEKILKSFQEKLLKMRNLAVGSVNKFSDSKPDITKPEEIELIKERILKPESQERDIQMIDNIQHIISYITFHKKK